MKPLSQNEMAKLALDAVKFSKQATEAAGEEYEYDKHFRARARSLFEWAYYHGQLQTMSFIYAKASSALVKRAFDSLERKDIQLLKSEGKWPEKEKTSYALYAATLLSYLKECGISVDASLDTALKLANDYGFMLMPYMLWLKMLAEAEIEA